VPVETETNSHPEHILVQFESIGDELRKLRERDEAATAQIKDLEKKLGHAEQWVRRLREKCEVLEKNPAIVDGVDEQFLWDKRCTLEFTRHVDGNRRLRIKDRGQRTLALVTHRPGQPGGDDMLRRAINKASGRDRK
jgi:hypothetical protein